jgi:hypothetical protein
MFIYIEISCLGLYDVRKSAWQYTGSYYLTFCQKVIQSAHEIEQNKALLCSKAF